MNNKSNGDNTKRASRKGTVSRGLYGSQGALSHISHVWPMHDSRSYGMPLLSLGTRYALYVLRLVNWPRDIAPISGLSQNRYSAQSCIS